MVAVTSLLLTVLCILVVHSEHLDPLTALSAEQWDVLGQMNIDDLPETMRVLLRTSRAAGDSNHWCCNIHPTKTIINTQSHMQYRATSHKEKHYKHCHTFGWGRCSTYTTVYAQCGLQLLVHYAYNNHKATYYVTTYHSRKVATTCPKQHVTCCKGFVLVANNCLPLSKLPEVSQDIIKLQQGGYLDKLVG